MHRPAVISLMGTVSRTCTLAHLFGVGFPEAGTSTPNRTRLSGVKLPAQRRPLPRSSLSPSPPRGIWWLGPHPVIMETRDLISLDYRSGRAYADSTYLVTVIEQLTSRPDGIFRRHRPDCSLHTGLFIMNDPLHKRC
jgi:hypothetical protein